jgi:hypothetical protein
MVKGKRVDNGEWVEGYLCLDTVHEGRIPFKSAGTLKTVTVIQVTRQKNYHPTTTIDPDTIEPVAVPVVIEPVYGYEDKKPSYYELCCPNCQAVFEDYEPDNKPNYCEGCGQRLDWSEVERREKETEHEADI